MEVFFSLIFTLVLLAIGFVCFCIPMLLIWLLFDQLLLQRMHKSIRIALPIILTPLLYVLAIGSFVLFINRPVAVFEMAFDFPPTSDVVIISASQGGIGDCGGRDITFTADRSTIDAITLKKFDTTLEASTLETDGTFRFRRDYSEIFATETEELTYNPKTSEANYTWQGID